ncbi:uncharacterized protein BO95DRAFT_464263 [Aspergillus brunneoviolaceus CBS 621.78]|uniref:Uncharacterized protein n=1 Tax=Aspergillus brunneoviolaceus CBS 621.78 TaxID=1450534 RepID=A0ACD1G7D5_9EURO|nr:hypothetical protein BO95DRAFT_464263 [Aspergillus brunneoviolaceus CBS 621.78]RAH45194.1 hypothetical protein BO95DRAFT_464263 [Aspergillus brunneoviolaceus CBS 621.78]
MEIATLISKSAGGIHRREVCYSARLHGENGVFGSDCRLDDADSCADIYLAFESPPLFTANGSVLPWCHFHLEQESFLFFGRRPSFLINSTVAAWRRKQSDNDDDDDDDDDEMPYASGLSDGDHGGNNILLTLLVQSDHSLARTRASVSRFWRSLLSSGILPLQMSFRTLEKRLDAVP